MTLTPLLLGLGVQELVIILVILLLLFGGSRLAGLGKSTGRALKEFKEETKGLGGDKDKVDDPVPPSQIAPPTQAAPGQYGSPQQHGNAQQYGNPQQHSEPHQYGNQPQYGTPPQHGNPPQYGTPPQHGGSEASGSTVQPQWQQQPPISNVNDPTSPDNLRKDV